MKIRRLSMSSSGLDKTDFSLQMPKKYAIINRKKCGSINFRSVPVQIDS